MNINNLSKGMQKNLVAFVVCSGVFIWSLSAGIVTIALPTISQYLDVGTSTVSWVIIAHLLVLTSFLLIFGKIGDYIGYKKVFMGGMFIFTVGSYFSGISTNITQLILSSIFKGIGSAMLLSMAPAIITSTFPNMERGKIFGYISLATTLALSLGYGVGGFLTEYLAWNWIFFAIVPFGLITLILAHLFLPETTKTEEYHGFDIIGSLLIFFTVTTLIVPLEMGGRMGWTSPLIISSFIISISLAVGFYRWESYYRHPLFNVCLLKQRYLNISIAAGFMSSFVLTGTIFLLPFYLELIMNYSTDLAGVVILIPTLLIIVIGPLSGRLSDYKGSKLPSIIGAVCLAIALIVLTILNPTIGTYGTVLVFLALLMRSLSDGMFSPANNKLVMSHSPKGMLGSVSSLLNTAKYLGLVMGVVIFETIFDSTVTNSASKVEGLSTTGAFQFTVPEKTLLMGFHGAFLLGAIISILIVIATLLSKESLENEENEILDMDPHEKVPNDLQVEMGIFKK